MKKTIGIFIAGILLTACSSFRSTTIEGGHIDPRVRAEQEGELKKADQAFANQNYNEAEDLYGDFQTRFPSSIFYQRAQFGRAQSLEALEHWSEAADLYRKTLEVTRERQPDIAAQALYHLAFCYENLGDEARVLASLKDALNMKEHLTPEQAQAEIPARMAASLNRMGQTKDAEQYFQQANQGIQRLRSRNAVDNKGIWIAQTYYRMGAFSTNQLSFENLQTTLDTLKMIQMFSLRSAEASGEPWSRKASRGLIENYRDIWKTIQHIPVNNALEAGAAKREQVDSQMNFAGQMLTLLNELRMYRVPDSRDESVEAEELFTTLTKLEKQASQFMTSTGDRTPLTPEAKKRGGLKR